jgi:type II secretory ATPase GspE/PulE/Tfp pilus assembly ATPase PilB-like protein
VPLHRAKGCDHCAGTGYRGRMGVYELLVADEEVRALVLARAGSHEIKKAARKAGTVTLREAALAKMTAGITTLEEVLRVTQDDSDADLAKK